MTDLDKLITGYSHPITRSRLGQEGWDKIKTLLMKRAQDEGKELPDYFEEEEVMDLDRANANHAEEDVQWQKG